MLRRKVPLGSENGGMMAIGGAGKWGYVTALEKFWIALLDKHTTNIQ
jgi:hypothetical protein